MTNESVRGSKFYLSSKVASNVSCALALAAIFAVLMCRLAIWFPPTMVSFWTVDEFWLALASTFQDYCVLLALIGLHWLFWSAAGRKPSGRRTVVDSIFAALYFLFIIVVTSNVISIHSIGAVLDVNWFGDIKPSNSSTLAAILTSIMTRSKAILIIGCVIIAPIASLVIHRKYPRDLGFYAAIALLSVLTSGTLSIALPAPADAFSRVYKTRNPIAGAIKSALLPSVTERLLAGEADVDPEAERRIGARDWRAGPKLPVAPCCKGMNVVLITVDSMPLKSVARDFILAHADQYPNLARLYQQSIAYDHFYTNYPSSTEALGVLLGSVYASNAPLQNSVKEWTGRDVPTLPAVLAENGYTSAHFLAGEIAYDGVGDFLTGRGFATIEDSYSEDCGTDVAALRVIYTTNGDDCTARAAMRWIDSTPPSPIFLWVWFTNPHTPYFINRDTINGKQGRSVARHAESIRDTDTAIGKLLRSLDDRKMTENSIIILMADHGEAFGEHGLYYHGTSLHDEQVRIPLLISAPMLPKNAVAKTLGSIIDLAPTITGLLGLPTPGDWQGQSLFAEGRKSRVYFTALSAGRMAGYREGNMKYILSSLDDQPFAYDLSRDSGEQHPITLPPMERRIVSARLGAFVRERNLMRWTKPQSKLKRR